MAVTYTKSQIRRIHSLRQAVKDQLYQQDSGELFVGTAEGYLKREIRVIGDVAGTSLQSSVERIGDYTTSEAVAILEDVANKLDKEEFEEYKKEAKCFTIAMAVAL
jgi:hypothetical protein